MSPTVIRGVQTGVGVLEDHLHAAALPAQALPRRLRQVGALVQHAPAGWR